MGRVFRQTSRQNSGPLPAPLGNRHGERHGQGQGGGHGEEALEIGLRDLIHRPATWANGENGLSVMETIGTPRWAAARARLTVSEA